MTAHDIHVYCGQMYQHYCFVVIVVGSGYSPLAHGYRLCCYGHHYWFMVVVDGSWLLEDSFMVIKTGSG